MHCPNQTRLAEPALALASTRPEICTRKDLILAVEVSTDRPRVEYILGTRSGTVAHNHLVCNAMSGR